MYSQYKRKIYEYRYGDFLFAVALSSSQLFLLLHILSSFSSCFSLLKKPIGFVATSNRSSRNEEATGGNKRKEI